MLLLMLLACNSFGQVSTDEAKLESLADTLFHAIAVPDTLVRDDLAALDSIQLEARNSFEGLKYSFDSITSVADNAATKLQQQIGILNQRSLPTDKLSARLDSIAQWKDAQLKKVEDRVQRLKTKVNDQINSLDLPNELKDKASAFTAEVNKLNISRLEAGFPELELPDNLPSVDGLGSSLSELNADLPDININAGSLGEVGEQVDAYTNAASDIIPQGTDDIPSMVESKAGDALEIDAVQEQLGEVSDLIEGMGELGNAEYVQGQLKREARQQAFDHFAGKQEQLEKAMETMSEYKRKYEDIQSVAELPRKRPNAMRGKPFVQRLVPGVAIQIHRHGAWLFDFNPYIGYRISGRLTTGLGWNQRIAYNFDEGEFANSLVIFGPRMYGEFTIAKGFSARWEGEYMKTQAPSQFSSGNTDEKGREWVFSTMAGIKKEYRILEGVKGTAMLLYNIYDPHHRSPHPNKLNVRFGFELALRKRKE